MQSQDDINRLTETMSRTLLDDDFDNCKFHHSSPVQLSSYKI
jgi:hypothetical protein